MPIEPGVLVFYLGNLINHYIRLYDLITEGSFHLFDPDLHTIIKALNLEFVKQINEFNKISNREPIQNAVPYEEFDRQLILDTWYNQQRPKIKMLDFDIKINYQSTTNNKLPNEYVVFGHNIEQLIKEYELKK